MNTAELDEIDQILLTELTRNARMPASALGQIVGLTRQAVSDRMDRLRSIGIIAAYTVAVTPESLGLHVRAFLEILLVPGCSNSEEQAVVARLSQSPWVRDCYRMSGEDRLQAMLLAPSTAAIKELALELRATGSVHGTRTLLALETIFEKSGIGYPPGVDVCHRLPVVTPVAFQT